MTALFPMLSLLIVMTFSLVIIRIASAVLVFTGVSMELARFQARSAFTGCGFTTSEAEQIVAHPVRRKVIGMLMFLGNAGIISAMVSVLSIVSSVENSQVALYYHILLIALGLVLLWLVALSPMVDHGIMSITNWALKKFTTLDVLDYHGLLHLSDGYTVTEIQVLPDHWLRGRNLIDLRLTDEGVQVLGIHRTAGEFIGAPRGSTFIRKDDTVILYGRSAQIQELEHRKADQEGENSHVRWCHEHELVLEAQEKADREGHAARSNAPIQSAVRPNDPTTSSAP